MTTFSTVHAKLYARYTYACNKLGLIARTAISTAELINIINELERDPRYSNPQAAPNANDRATNIALGRILDVPLTKQQRAKLRTYGRHHKQGATWAGVVMPVAVLNAIGVPYMPVTA